MEVQDSKPNLAKDANLNQVTRLNFVHLIQVYMQVPAVPTK